jgi:hypothetical protein
MRESPRVLTGFDPRLPMFAALAEALGVSMDVLWYGEEEAARIARERGRPGRPER